MADNRRDIEFLIRAKDLSSKPFNDVAKAISSVTASLDEQVAAAKKGDVSAAELRDTFRQLEQASNALLKQQALIDHYAKLSAQLGNATQQAQEAAAAAAKLQAANDGAEKTTRKQEQALAAANRASEGAQRRVEALTASLNVQRDKLNQAGIGTRDLAGAQEKIRAAATEVGGALTKVDGALTTYNKTLRETKNEQKALNAEMARAAEKAAFRKLGDDALAATNNLDSLAAEETKVAANTSRLAQALGAIIDPATASIQTLAGLENRLEAISTELGQGQKSIYSYAGVVNDLSQAQSVLLRQAKDVDSFKNQTAVVRTAEAAYREAREEVTRLANAVRTADEPNDELAASLSTARQRLIATNKELENERKKLDALAVSLQKAEIDVNDLAAAERRLEATANKAAAASQKLDAAASGKNSRAGRFLGLKPYEIQNLGFQLNDVFTQLASGTRPMQVLAQQGGQIAQIFPGAFSAIIRFIPGITAAGVALFTVFNAFRRINEISDLTRKFTAQLKATADGAAYTASQLADTTRALDDYGASLQDATAASNTFRKEGVPTDQLKAFALSAKDAADVLGIKVPEAASKMAEAFTGGFAEVKKLDDELNFLTASERRHIKAMFDSGQTAGARAEAFRIFNRQMHEGAVAMRTDWSEALKNFGKAWNNLLDAIGNSSIIQNTLRELRELAEFAAEWSGKIPGASGAQSGGTRAAGGGGLPGGVRTRGPGLLQTLAMGAVPGMAPILGRMTGGGRIDVTADISAIVRTVMLEARRNPQAQQDVAAVILNRMERSGMTARQVVTAPGQFQPVGDPGSAIRKRWDAIDIESKEFQETLRNILPILKGTVADPVNGAVNFYSPAGQRSNVAKGLSRDLVPKFARDASKMTANRYGHQFFTGSFPGDKGSQAQAVAATEAQKKAGDEYIAQLLKEQAAIMKVSDAERIRQAGLDALREAQSRNVGPAAEKEAQRIAEETKRWEIERERAEQQKALAQQLASTASTAAAGQDANLAQRLDAISQRFKIIYTQIEEARQKGLTEVDGKPLAEVEKLIRANEAILKQQETMKFYEQQLADLERQRAEEIKSIQAAQGTGALSPQAALAALAEVNSRLLPKIQAVAIEAEKFAKSLRGATPDPKLEAFIASMTGAEIQAARANVAETLKIAEDAVKAIEDQLAAELEGINALASAGEISSTEAFNRATQKVAELGPQIRSLADEAIKFAEAFRTATPDPQLEAFISKMRSSAAQSVGSSTRSPALAVGTAQATEQERKLNDLLAQRNEIVQQYQVAVETGRMTQYDANQEMQRAFQTFQPLIEKQIATIRELVTAMHDAGVISDELFASWNARLNTTAMEAAHVRAEFTQMRDTIISSFVSGVSQAFNTVAEAVGNAIAGTGSWEDALRSLGTAALQFASSFLKSIADMMIQMLAMRAIQSMPFLNPMASGLSGGAMLMPAATALAGASTTLVAAGTSITAGAAALTPASVTASAAGAALSAGGVSLASAGPILMTAAAAISAAAVQLQVAASINAASSSVGVFHSGGLPGTLGGRTRSVSPLAFVGAPRYHAGRAALGLKHDEATAILQRGEEVLSSDDPRNILNAGKSGGQSAAPRSMRVVGVFDPSEIPRAMASAAGEETILTTLKRNTPAVRQILGMNK